MSELAKRIGTAVILAPIAAGAMYLGGWYFAAFFVLVAIVGQWELYRMAAQRGFSVFQAAALPAGGLIILIPIWSSAAPLVAIAFVALVCSELWRRQDDAIANAAVGVLGVIYPASFLVWYLHIRVAGVHSLGDTGAFWLTLSIMISVWSADTFAYFVGKSIGKKPLFPRISPQKTIEGTIGGIVGSIGVMIFLSFTLIPFLGLIHAIVLGMIAGIVGPLGDLIESLFKRSVNVKDSGSLLPGHGGVLDRIDALLFVGPVAVIYLQHVARLF